MTGRQKIHLFLNVLLIFLILFFFIWKFVDVRSPVTDEDNFGLIMLCSFLTLAVNSFFNVVAVKSDLIFSRSPLLRFIRVFVRIVTIILFVLFLLSFIAGIYFTFFSSFKPFEDKRARLGLLLLGILCLVLLTVLIEQFGFEKIRKKKAQEIIDSEIQKIGEQQI